ncbi:glycoside hydrolase family 13 protein [Halosolutus amylolyticus]|uniref:Glycoside hydrolase family 13 protein n=1 Tax=Halosolutus amylolyticus TaxID=2932267 RepID=A0ABD5PSI3_9EURY|nr:glycoside hydrolase family 13 protein [Halosolutus amylolyticus]
MTICREAVHHKPKSNYAYAFDETTVHVRLRTKHGDVDRCRLLHGDKFEWPESTELTPMERVHSDAHYDYWQLAVEPDNRRLCYAFLLETADEALWYTEWGFESRAENELPTAGTDRSLHYFEYPFLNPADVHEPPEWVSDAIFYQIFPERFANGDRELDPESVEAWGGRPTRESFFGGDLQGIIDNLDYLEDLGITALYLNPIFESSSNHKYNTADYRRIDPHFGDEETLRELVDAAHDRDIRVMLDAVFNHCGRQFAPFQDVVENGADSAYADWFHVHEFPIEFEPRPNYDTFGFEAYMPKLNTGNPEVKEYLFDVATYWIEEVGIDGWRLDVADEVDHQFWRELRREVKAVKPGAYILGEIWHDSRPWLRGDQFDAVMNYPFTYAVYDFLTNESIDGTEFADKISRFLVRYPEQVNQVLFNLLDSHDTPRLLHRCDGDKRSLRLALLLLFTYRGTPCLYYGDEVGMTGGDDPDCRQPMVWDRSEQDRELRAFVAELIELRSSLPALRGGTLRFVDEECHGDRVVYRRIADDGDEITVAINRGPDPVDVSLPTDARDRELLFQVGDSDLVQGEDGQVTLSPTSGAVWR